MQPIIELNSVNHVYFHGRASKWCVQDIDLTVDKGEFVSLVGPSGCGKTSLLSIISGLMQPTSGKVVVNGHTLNGVSPSVGYMLQQDYLFPWRTILQNILVGLELKGQLNDESIHRGKQLLSRIGLNDTEYHYPSQLSGGMRQRVALARTLMTNPEVLLLDEPFSALDYQTKLQLEQLVSEHLKQQQKTVVLITHDLSEAIAVSDRIIVLKSHPGKITKQFVVPTCIRNLTPIYAREHPEFHSFFQSIRGELDNDKEVHKHVTKNTG